MKNGQIQLETLASFDEPLGFDCGDVSSMDCILTGSFSTKICINIIIEIGNLKLQTNLD